MAKVALLVGVSEYEPGLNPLPAAVKDVEAMRRVLAASELGGFDEVKALANLDSQAMQYEIETLFSGRSKDDLVLLFFSGHGIKDDSGRLYFATRNTRKNSKNELIRSTAVPASFVHEVMNGSRARRQAIILDCCFSGAFDPALIARDDSSVDLQGQLGAEGRVVLTSSSSTQYSFEQQGSDLSIYTRYLVEGIETGAGDRDEDGKVSMRELHEYAVSKVQETAPNMTPKMVTLKDMGFEIVLSKAKIADPKLSYRRQVERYTSRGEISNVGRTILDTLRTQLGLSTEEATAIEDEVLRPYRKRLENLQRYREAFAAAIENEYPVGEITLAELRDLSELLGLRRKDIEPIETDETTKKVAIKVENYQEAKNEQHEQKNLKQQKIQPVQQEQNKQALKQQDRSNQSLEQDGNVQSSRNRTKITVAIAGSSFLLLGGILFFNRSPSPNNATTDNAVKTYTADALTITGNRQHVCNVLLPRGPGIGGSFFYPGEETLWKDLRCEELYCNLSDANCRTSLKPQWAKPDQQSADDKPSTQSSSNAEFEIIDQVIQFPDKPLPERSYEVESLAPQQASALNNLLNKFSKVDSSSEPVASGSATTYEGWNALCIGEQGQSGCPRSAKHEFISYGAFSSDKRLWTSRGWVLYKP